MPKDEELVKAALKKRLEDKSSAPVKLSEFLDSRDLTSQGTESSFKLSDLKDFLGLAHKDDLSKVAANIQDLNKMNANKLTQLLRASAELFYTQQEDIGSSVNVYRSAIHALLLKTIEKTLEESKKSGLSLADTIKKINTITEMVEPEAVQHQDINLLNDFSAYQDPFKQSIQDLMFKFFYPKPIGTPEKPVDILKERLEHADEMKELHKLCFDKLKIGKQDRDLHIDRLLSKKKKLEHDLEAIQRETPEDKEKFLSDNGISADRSSEIKDDFLKDRETTLKLQLEVVRNHLRALHTKEVISLSPEEQLDAKPKDDAPTIDTTSSATVAVDATQSGQPKQSEQLEAQYKAAKHQYKKQIAKIEQDQTDQANEVAALQFISKIYEVISQEASTVVAPKDKSRPFYGTPNATAFSTAQIKSLHARQQQLMDATNDPVLKEKINQYFSDAIQIMRTKVSSCIVYGIATPNSTGKLKPVIDANNRVIKASLDQSKQILEQTNLQHDSKKNSYSTQEDALKKQIQKAQESEGAAEKSAKRKRRMQADKGAKQSAANTLLEDSKWEDRIPSGLLSAADYDHYVQLIKKEINDPANAGKTQIKILASTYDDKLKDSEGPLANTISWRQMYDVTIDKETGQCILSFQMCRGTSTESLGISKGNFGDVTFAFELFTGKGFAVKEENTMFQGVNSKKAILGSLTRDPQDTIERKQEDLVTIESGLSDFQSIESRKINFEKLLDEMLREHPYASEHIREKLKDRMLRHDKQGKLLGPPPPDADGNISYDECWTIQELLRSKEDFKDEIIKEVNEVFKREMAACASDIAKIKEKTGATQEDTTYEVTQKTDGSSEFYDILNNIRSLKAPVAEQTADQTSVAAKGVAVVTTEQLEKIKKVLKEDLKKRFEKGVGYLEGLVELKDKKIIHGDIKPKNFKGGRFFDFGTSWLERQIEENNKKGAQSDPSVGTIDSVRLGTVEFIPPEYVFAKPVNHYDERNKDTPEKDVAYEKDKDGKVVVKVTYEGDIYSAGVSLFNYTDLETYKKAFEWHYPGTKFCYTDAQMADNSPLIKWVDGRKYIRIYDDSKAEASGLELLEELSVLKDKYDKFNILHTQFDILYTQLEKLFQEMCHWDPKKRTKSAEIALTQFVDIRNRYLNLLKDVKDTKSLDELLQAAKEESNEPKKIGLLKNEVEVEGENKSLILAVVSEYFDYQNAKIKEAITGLSADGISDALGLFDPNLRATDSPLLTAVEKDKTKIFQVLLDKIKYDNVKDILSNVDNIHRDIIYIAAKKNNLEMLEAIFAKLKSEDAQLKIDLILGNAANKSGLLGSRETGYNLLEWASYHKNIPMLEFLTTQLNESLKNVKPVKKEDEKEKHLLLSSQKAYEQTGTLNVPTTKVDVAESIFHSVAYSNDIKQFIVLCNLFNKTGNIYKTLNDIPIEIFLKLSKDEWRDAQGLTPFALFFSKNEQFVDAVFSKSTGNAAVTALNSVLNKQNVSSAISPIQLAFIENDNQILEKILTQTTNNIFDLKDSVGNTPLYYLVKHGNLTIIKKIVDALSKVGDDDKKYGAQKKAFIAALTTPNKNNITPLAALIVRDDSKQCVNDQDIFNQLMRMVPSASKNSQAMGFVRLVENLGSSQTVTNSDEIDYKNKLFAIAVKNKKFDIAVQIIDASDSLPKNDIFKAFFIQLQGMADSNDVSKNVFHYMFEDKLSDSVFKNISTKLIKYITAAQDSDLKMIESIILMFSSATQDGKTPFSLAIQSGQYQEIVKLLTNKIVDTWSPAKQKVWYQSIEKILLTPCEGQDSLLAYALQSDKHQSFIDNVLLPIFMKMLKADQDVSSIIGKINDCIEYSSLPDGCADLLAEKIIAVYDKYNETKGVQQELEARIADLESKIATSMRELGIVKHNEDNKTVFETAVAVSEEAQEIINALSIQSHSKLKEITVLSKGLDAKISQLISEHTKNYLLAAQGVKDELSEKKALYRDVKWLFPEKEQSMLDTIQQCDAIIALPVDDPSQEKMFEMFALYKEITETSSKLKEIVVIPANVTKVANMRLCKAVDAFQETIKDSSAIIDKCAQIDKLLANIPSDARSTLNLQQYYAVRSVIEQSFLNGLLQTNQQPTIEDLKITIGAIENAQKLLTPGVMTSLNVLHRRLLTIEGENDTLIVRKLGEIRAEITAATISFNADFDKIKTPMPKEPAVTDALGAINKLVDKLWNSIVLDEKILNKQNLLNLPAYSACMESIVAHYGAIYEKSQGGVVNNIEQLINNSINKFQQDIFKKISSDGDLSLEQRITLLKEIKDLGTRFPEFRSWIEFDTGVAAQIAELIKKTQQEIDKEVQLKQESDFKLEKDIAKYKGVFQKRGEVPAFASREQMEEYKTKLESREAAALVELKAIKNRDGYEAAVGTPGAQQKIISEALAVVKTAVDGEGEEGVAKRAELEKLLVAEQTNLELAAQQRKDAAMKLMQNFARARVSAGVAGKLKQTQQQAREAAALEELKEIKTRGNYDAVVGTSGAQQKIISEALAVVRTAVDGEGEEGVAKRAALEKLLVEEQSNLELAAQQRKDATVPVMQKFVRAMLFRKKVNTLVDNKTALRSLAAKIEKIVTPDAGDATTDKGVLIAEAIIAASTAGETSLSKADITNKLIGLLSKELQEVITPARIEKLLNGSDGSKTEFVDHINTDLQLAAPTLGIEDGTTTVPVPVVESTIDPTISPFSSLVNTVREILAAEDEGATATSSKGDLIVEAIIAASQVQVNGQPASAEQIMAQLDGLLPPELQEVITVASIEKLIQDPGNNKQEFIDIVETVIRELSSPEVSEGTVSILGDDGIKNTQEVSEEVMQYVKELERNIDILKEKDRLRVDILSKQDKKTSELQRQLKKLDGSLLEAYKQEISNIVSNQLKNTKPPEEIKHITEKTKLLKREQDVLTEKDALMDHLLFKKDKQVQLLKKKIKITTKPKA